LRIKIKGTDNQNDNKDVLDCKSWSFVSNKIKKLNFFSGLKNFSLNKKERIH